MAFIILKMNNHHDNISSYHIENLSKSFCFTYISTWENERTFNFGLKDVPPKALQKLYTPIPITNQKNLSKIFNMMVSDIVM
jgi:hypothetical protein